MANEDQYYSLFYNSVDGDRVYDADSFEYLLKKFFTPGVFAGDCRVQIAGGMTVSMGTGYANLDGKVRVFMAPVSLTLQTAHATYDRIDTIVIERNDSTRSIDAKVVTGNYSLNPVPTAPVRANGIWQLVVAQIRVKAGAVQINQGDITDTRPNSSICGYVMTAVQTPDFSDLFDTFLEQANSELADMTSAADAWMEASKDDFDTWFATIKTELDGDVAANLQRQISDIGSPLTDDEIDEACV